jgi:hypothetical protein
MRRAVAELIGTALYPRYSDAARVVVVPHEEAS